MSLVICSNKATDATTTSRSQSIFKPFSFRNSLASTMKIAKNSQVALESVKYNLDGTIAISQESYIVYQYYGEKLGADEDLEHSTAMPIRVPLISTSVDQVVELSYTELIERIQEQLNKFIFHPNLRDLITCEIKRNSTTDELEGIIINYDYFDGTANTIPTNASEFGNGQFLQDGENAGWTYGNASFLTNDQATSNDDPAVAILTDYPISLHNGVLKVNFNSPNGDNVDWAVGLSRYTTFRSSDDFRFTPNYCDVDIGDQGPEEKFYTDFCVFRRNNLLKICHTALDSQVDNDITMLLDVEYGNDDIPNDYNLNTNASAWESVKFTCIGEQMKIEMVDNGGNSSVLYTYNASNDTEDILKPINQACWTMYPVLHCFRDAVTNGNSLVVEEYTGATNISNHNIANVNNSYYQSTANDSFLPCKDIESRPWNDEQKTGAEKAAFLIQAGLKGGPNDVIDLDNALITKPSDVYTPSFDANTDTILGMDVSPNFNSTFGSGGSSTRRIFESDTIPKLLSTKTMFVRLENFGVNSINARQGNKSSIIAHLPRFDGQVETGRIYHQPKNL